MASNSLQSRAIGYIDEIYDLLKSNRNNTMIKSVIDFTLFIESNSHILYSDVNRYFHKIGLVTIFMNVCVHVPLEQSKPILRLLQFFIKTNTNIRNEVENRGRFITYVFRTLDKEYLWNNIEMYIDHIRILEQILVESDSLRNSYSLNINKLFQCKVKESADIKTIMSYISFYACCRHILNSGTNSQNLSSNKDICKYLSKPIFNGLKDVAEEIIKSFQNFFNHSDNKEIQYTYFEINSEYTFNQICHIISYYSSLDEKICDNFFEASIFLVISKILFIKYIPENFILKFLDVLMVPLRYSKRETYSQSSTDVYNSLNAYLQSELYSNEIRDKTILIQNQMSIPKPENSHSNTSEKNTLSFVNVFMSSEQFESFNTIEWLINNGLSHLCTRLSRLSGKGLKQLKLLVNETHGKMKLINLLTSQMNMNITEVLELLGCLENLQIE